MTRFQVPQRRLRATQENLCLGEASLGEQPKLLVEPPQPDLLAHGVAYFRFRTENVQIAGVRHGGARSVAPDRTSSDCSGRHPLALDRCEPKSGGHRRFVPGHYGIRITLVDAKGQRLAQQVVHADVP